MSFIDNIRYKLGLVSREELFKALQPEREQYASTGLPPALESMFREACSYAEDLKNAKNPEDIFVRLNAVQEQAGVLTRAMNPSAQVDEQREKIAYTLSADQVAHYTPAGARMWKFFLNPMGIFTFIGETHWSTKAAIAVVRTEIQDEGFKLHYHPSVTPERLVEVDRIFDSIGLKEYYVNTCTYYLTYQNVWTKVERNILGQPIKLTNLYADKIWPVFTNYGENLERWEYQVGNSVIPYELDEILHLKGFSLKSKHLGTPLLAPLVTEIEADMAASALTNAIMNKAGMIGVIIALEDPHAKNPLRITNMDRQQDKLQQTINNKFTGVRGAHSVLVANYIRDVYKLTDIGSMDANFQKLRIEVAKSVCVLLGVPPERLAIPRTESLQYQAAAVENIIQASFDKSLNSITNTVCDFINKKIIKEELGIYDVEIKPRGRFSANTINGARMAYMASLTGPIFDVNEVRTWFYRVPELPPGDSRGRLVLDNSLNRKMDSTPALEAQIDPREVVDLDQTAEQDLDHGEGNYTDDEDGD